MSLLKDVDRDNDSLFVFITKPESFNVHTHIKGQLAFFEGGSGHLYTNDTNYFIPTNYIAWIPAGVAHNFVHLKRNKLSVRNFYIPVANIDDPIFKQVGVYNSNPFMQEIFKFLDGNEYAPNSETYRFFMSFMRLLPNLLTDKLSIYLPVTNHNLIEKVIEYVLVNLSNPISLNEIANTFNLGTRTFSRLFFKEVGLTFYQYLKQARIMKSIELIIENKLSINEIAYEVGYSSIAAFSNSFFALTNKRPTEYKHKND